MSAPTNIENMSDTDKLSVRAAIRAGAEALTASDTPLLDARVLMKAALKCDDADLIARETAPLGKTAANLFATMIARRRNQEPVAQILGEKEFWGLTFALEPGVLTPRPDSETLIDAVLSTIPDRHQPLRVLDLGVGSGCLLCALLTELPNADGTGVDINPQAVSLAQRNLQAHRVSDRARVLEGNWFQPVDGQFDIILSNPPYIPASEKASLPRDVIAFEDPRALFAGDDGLNAYRVILNAIERYLTAQGNAAIEIGDGQVALLSQLIEDAGVFDYEIRSDLSGAPRAALVRLKQMKR